MDTVRRRFATVVTETTATERLQLPPQPPPQRTNAKDD